MIEKKKISTHWYAVSRIRAGYLFISAAYFLQKIKFLVFNYCFEMYCSFLIAYEYGCSVCCGSEVE